MHQGAVYVREGVPREEQPFEGMTLPEAMEAVLRPRQPMGLMELVLAMKEADYQTIMRPKRFTDAVRTVLEKDERFVEDAGKWAVV